MKPYEYPPETFVQDMQEALRMLSHPYGALLVSDHAASITPRQTTHNRWRVSPEMMNDLLLAGYIRDATPYTSPLYETVIVPLPPVWKRDQYVITPEGRAAIEKPKNPDDILFEQPRNEIHAYTEGVGIAWPFNVFCDIYGITLMFQRKASGGYPWGVWQYGHKLCGGVLPNKPTDQDKFTCIKLAICGME